MKIMNEMSLHKKNIWISLNVIGLLCLAWLWIQPIDTFKNKTSSPEFFRDSKRDSLEINSKFDALRQRRKNIEERENKRLSRYSNLPPIPAVKIKILNDDQTINVDGLLALNIDPSLQPRLQQAYDDSCVAMRRAIVANASLEENPAKHITTLLIPPIEQGQMILDQMRGTLQSIIGREKLDDYICNFSIYYKFDDYMIYETRIDFMDNYDTETISNHEVKLSRRDVMFGSRISEYSMSFDRFKEDYGDFFRDFIPEYAR
ncbi:hypothetical protein JIN85_09025 [Luteolibacter pohnpeiensis]|uniref:Uncharacterized protein n=1 Tax=Luteolibacter pohnpeiensis TaxID=454153 RepID=A0A934S5C6_9BACT|nr:hypothetical protein [Luteolibacter pohnpeiensis]MBK1882557.1 hypothetical protein [Luteolibacter pohnpeiensis]